MSEVPLYTAAELVMVKGSLDDGGTHTLLKLLLLFFITLKPRVE